MSDRVPYPHEGGELMQEIAASAERFQEFLRLHDQLQADNPLLQLELQRFRDLTPRVDSADLLSRLGGFPSELQNKLLAVRLAEVAAENDLGGPFETGKILRIGGRVKLSVAAPVEAERTVGSFTFQKQLTTGAIIAGQIIELATAPASGGRIVIKKRVGTVSMRGLVAPETGQQRVKLSIFD